MVIYMRVSMKIPKTFQLGGHKFKVKKRRSFENDNLLGFCKYLDNEIHIRTHQDNKPMSETMVTHTYCHEIVHAILITMNENDLNGNEQFVDVFAGLLHQVLDSSKY